MIPSVSILKSDGNTGVVRPSDVGVLAIIAAGAAGIGTTNQAEMFLRDALVLEEFGGGALAQCAAYVLPTSGNPVVCVKADGTTPGAYGEFTIDGADTPGTATADAASGAAVPIDDFDVLITFVHGAAAIGTPEATYTYSLDGGRTTSKIFALGTDTSIDIDDAGITVDLGVSGTIIAGDTIAFKTTGPVNNSTDLGNALEALRVTRSPFEAVLVDMPIEAADIGTIDTWLKALAVVGRFKIAIVTVRARETDETEAEYKLYCQGIRDTAASTDVIVCADVGDVSSSIPGLATTGIVQARPVGWAVAARLMRISIGTDAAQKDLGPVSQFGILDARGNPKYHDEYSYPGLDDLQFTTLRTFDGSSGSFITNANLFSSSGSDYVYAQHARCINRACEIAYEILANQLSRGVQKNPKAGPNGERYIAEVDATRIEGVANNAIRTELSGQVDDIRFAVSRTDDLSSNAGATVTGTIQSVALAYIKKFALTAGFVKSISQ